MKARLGGDGFTARGVYNREWGGYSRLEGVYSQGSNGRGWLFGLQRRDEEETIQATVILQ